MMLIARKRDQPAFCVGWKWHDAGANAIHNECCKRRLKVPIIGVPKTIDNDILLTDKTFGFNTAVEEAQRAINSAYIEAHSAYHGIGIVKLMGRSSGFIAMHASLANGQVDICLIPEVPFTLHGPDGDLSHLKYLIETKGSAVVCVAEGAGQTNRKIKFTSGCSKIDKLEEDMMQMESLTTLIAKDTAVKEVPYSIVRSKSIYWIISY
ncbi:Phosphofructokinase domain [Sesbania bispinosa]|nr:Phosphofructokinase domain [Sesbania bispinosa]